MSTKKEHRCTIILDDDLYYEIEEERRKRIPIPPFSEVGREILREGLEYRKMTKK